LCHQRGGSIRKVFGNTNGLKPGQIKALERIYRRLIRADVFITPELARYLTEHSRALQRQIGIIATRNGEIVCTIVGDDREIVIPDLTRYRGGRGRLRGLRCVHTHLKGEPLTQDDLNDLALLRLDLIAALDVDGHGLSGRISIGYLLPENAHGDIWHIDEYRGLHEVNLNFQEFIGALEDELQNGLHFYDTEDKERAFLVSVVPYGHSYPVQEALDELRELSNTADLDVIGTMVQRPKRIHPNYLMGQGKLKELIIKVLQSGADIIVFDQDLTASQVNSIGEVTDLKVIDRTQLILDIFAKRAHSRDGKVRVELAQLKYLMPRLTGRGTAMSRLMGGIGGRGPGETKLEMDRRRIKNRIHRLSRELDHLGKGRWQRRRARQAHGFPVISIVGYTNAGKSTLLNTLTKSHVTVENKLFATLDTASRRLRFPREREVIVTDTVGFIRNLPPDLLGAFRSTLDELHDADLLIHVIDVSTPRVQEQITTVEDLLRELGLGDTALLRVFNKQDTVGPDRAQDTAKRLGGVAISALDDRTLGPLLENIEETLWGHDRIPKESAPGNAGSRPIRHAGVMP